MGRSFNHHTWKRSGEYEHIRRRRGGSKNYIPIPKEVRHRYEVEESDLYAPMPMSFEAETPVTDEDGNPVRNEREEVMFRRKTEADYKCPHTGRNLNISPNGVDPNIKAMWKEQQHGVRQ